MCSGRSPARRHWGGADGGAAPDPARATTAPVEGPRTGEGEGAGLGSGKETGAKYVRFSLVGGSNALVDLGVLNLLIILFPTRSPELLVAYNAAALVLANANSYLWNTLWTFGDEARHDAKQVGLFTAQGLLNVAVGGALFWLAAHGLKAYTDLSPWAGGNAAKAVSTVAASTVSFLFLRFFVFRGTER